MSIIKFNNNYLKKKFISDPEYQELLSKMMNLAVEMEGKCEYFTNP